MQKKPDNPKVTCLACENLALHDSKPDSWCYAYSKNITEEEVTFPKKCSRFEK
jgi:hypothetical protein